MWIIYTSEKESKPNRIRVIVQQKSHRAFLGGMWQNYSKFIWRTRCCEEPTKSFKKQKQNDEWALALPDIRIHLKTIIMKSGALVRIRKTWKWKGEASGIFEFTCLIHGEDMKSVRKRFSEYGWGSLLIYGEKIVSFFMLIINKLNLDRVKIWNMKPQTCQKW